MDFEGVVIEESLDDTSILKRLKIKKTVTERVTEEFHTPWLKKWTLHTVMIPEKDADSTAKAISRALSDAHSSNWYADFKNDKFHYIIFKNKTFKIKRDDQKGFDEARRYGISIGIPEHQVNFKTF